MFNDLQAGLHSSMRRNYAVKRRQPVNLSIQPRTNLEKRRSGRLTNQPATDYDERALDKADSTRAYRPIREPSLFEVHMAQVFESTWK